MSLLAGSEFFNRLFRSAFARNADGSIAIIFAVALVALLLVAGAGIDIIRLYDRQSKLQAAVDAATLAAVTHTGSSPDRQAAAEAAFAANFGNASEASMDPLKVTISSTQVTVEATGSLKTGLMGLAGLNSVPLHALAESMTGGMDDVEVALVVDVSGSMRSGMGTKDRIGVLKDSATALVDTLTSNGSKMGKVKVGVVPFNMNVNIGTANSAYVQGLSNPLFGAQAWAGCVMERAWPESNTDAYDGGSGATGKFFAYAAPPEPNNGTTGVCLNPSNGTNGGYASVDAGVGYEVQTMGPNYNCVRHPLMPLSSNYSDIKSKIDSLTAEYNMGTIIAPGVAWGLRLLSPDEPFTEGAPYAAKTHKFMVVLTDGELTTEGEYGVQYGCDGHTNSSASFNFDPAGLGLKGKAVGPNGPLDAFSAYGYMLDSDPLGTGAGSWSSLSDDLEMVSLDACTKAKTASADGAIEVFTIAVSNGAGPGTRVYNMLRTCATDDNHFFYAADAQGFTDAFSAITKKISQVRLTR